MGKYILALDQGTTSSRAIVFDHKGNTVSSAQQEFAQIYPQPSWVEHDATSIWKSQIDVARLALRRANLEAVDIVGIGITNQRETTVVWDRVTGEPIHNAIVWQDRRTARMCDDLKEQGHLNTFQDKTGLLLDAYFSGTKVKWLLDNVAGARERAKRGELAFGTIDSWLIWHLTGGSVHVTDVSNASRTLLFNIQSLQWDDELLVLLDIPRAMLPTVKSSSEIYGYTQLLGSSIPISGVAGDQHAALFGQMCIESGMVKNTYGTGCFMMMNTGDVPVKSNNQLLTTIAWQIDGQVQYALEGSIFIAGALVQWLRDGLNLIESASQIEALAASVPDSDGVCLVPAFAGLGAPQWNPKARGSMFGITRGTTRAHIARAAMDAIAHQVTDVLDAMRKDAGVPLTNLRVDGGASTNNVLMQTQADLLGICVVRPKMLETTALGVAYLAGLAVGFWSGVDELKQHWQVDAVFERSITNQLVNKRRDEWLRAVSAVEYWSNSKG
jgi:glycerol kinase